MKLERIEDQIENLPPNYKGTCPDCEPPYNNVTYVHDMKCQVCDNSTIVFCVNCRRHFKVIP